MEQRFLLDKDSICYGCSKYKNILDSDVEEGEYDMDEHKGVCTCKQPCVHGHLNDYANIKVYKFCECDLIVTNKSLDETIAWYNKEFMEADESDVEEIDMDMVKINVEEDDEYQCDTVTVKEYIADIDEEYMPMIFASQEY